MGTFASIAVSVETESLEDELNEPCSRGRAVQDTWDSVTRRFDLEEEESRTSLGSSVLYSGFTKNTESRPKGKYPSAPKFPSMIQ